MAGLGLLSDGWLVVLSIDGGIEEAWLQGGVWSGSGVVGWCAVSRWIRGESPALGALDPLTGFLGLVTVSLCLLRLALGVEGGDGVDVDADLHCQQQCDSSCPDGLLHLMWSGGGSSCGWCIGF